MLHKRIKLRVKVYACMQHILAADEYNDIPECLYHMAVHAFCNITQYTPDYRVSYCSIAAYIYITCSNTLHTRNSIRVSSV